MYIGIWYCFDKTYLILELSSTARNRNDGLTVDNVGSSYVRDSVKLDDDEITPNNGTSTTKPTLSTKTKNEDKILNSSSLGRLITCEKFDNHYHYNR